MQAARTDTPHFYRFCQQIVADPQPMRVTCQPIPNQPEHECFATVQRRVAEAGGERVLGWAIWERPGVFLEAELHAIWRAPTGEHLDIARRPQWFPCITFLPDPQYRYQGRQVDNIRQALVEDADVKLFLFLARRRFEILNTGALAEQHGEITLPGKLGREYLKTVKELARLEKRLERKYPA